MVGGGPFDLSPGQWTDDTSMALCLAESLLTRGGFDPTDQMTRYVDWWRRGYKSSTGRCFDIGMTVRSALFKFEATKQPYAGSDDPRSAGNGALMRLAPVVLFYYPDLAKAQAYAVESSRTTHAAPEALDCARLLSYLIAGALAGSSKAQLLRATALGLASPKVVNLASGSYVTKDEADIAGTGYCVASLEAALWCFHHTQSFEEAILRAANLGDDADTTAAIVGQVAGAYYGLDGIPRTWRACLHMGDAIAQMGYALGSVRSSV
jgi:ADP-ribosyl-[dinitrogen reductase] hydrolase